MSITAKKVNEEIARLEEIARYVRDESLDVKIDICEFLMVDKKNPKIYYCGLTGKEINITFKPCVLPTEDRIVLCPFYRDYWFKAKLKGL